MNNTLTIIGGAVSGVVLTFMVMGLPNKKQSIPHSIEITSNSCTAIEDAARRECAVQLEERFYMAGAFNYDRQTRLLDSPVCKNIGERIMQTCKQQSKD